MATPVQGKPDRWCPVHGRRTQDGYSGAGLYCNSIVRKEGLTPIICGLPTRALPAEKPERSWEIEVCVSCDALVNGAGDLCPSCGKGLGVKTVRVVPSEGPV